jgi:hypothetical protein
VYIFSFTKRTLRQLNDDFAEEFQDRLGSISMLNILEAKEPIAKSPIVGVPSIDA